VDVRYLLLTELLCLLFMCGRMSTDSTYKQQYKVLI